jgi:hypothetical protein
MPLSFSSIEEARDALDHMRTFAVRYVEPWKAQSPSAGQPDPAKIASALQALRSLSLIRLQHWSTAFDALTQAHSNDEISQEAVHILKMHRILMGINFSVDQLRAAVDETVWDEYTPQFEAILLHGSVLLDPYSWPHTGRNTSKRLPSFSLDWGINFPVFYVATKCRHGSIRRRAINLLRATERQEGVMNSLLAATIASRMVSIEEEGLVPENAYLRADEIPGSSRILGVEFRWETDRSVFWKYHKTKSNGDEEGRKEVVQEWISGDSLNIKC